MNAPFRIAVLFLSLVVLAGGCAVLTPGPPADLVVMPLRAPTPQAGERLPEQLIVGLPSADPAVDTNRILALMRGYELKALDSTRWASPVPWMVQQAIIDSLEGTGRFRVVAREVSAIDATLRLSLDLRRFYLVYAEGESVPSAEVMLALTLVDLRTGRVFAHTTISGGARCAGNSVKDFVAAFSAAMNGTLDKMDAWVTRSVVEHRADSLRR